MLKVTNIRLAVGQDESELSRACAKRLRVPANDVTGYRILRKSLDVRDKSRLEYVYTLSVSVPDEAKLLLKSPKDVIPYTPIPFEFPTPGNVGMAHRPVIVGAGPAGLFAAYVLAQHGYFPLLLERGQPVSQRIKDVEAFDLGGPLDVDSNYLFGEGGAGTFSDGKLTCRNTGPDTEKVLEIFAESKGKPSILYESRPHLGSNRLPAVVKSLRRQVLAMGGEVRFGCKVEDLLLDQGRVVGVRTANGTIPADAVLLAIGHSARDTYEMLHSKGVPMEARPFQMGVRIEQPQTQVNRIQFGTGKQAQLLGAASYSLNCTVGDRELFTFCMCAGGYVMPSVSQEEYFCTNGMSRSKHESPYANSGLVVTVDPAQLQQGSPDPLVGVRFQARIENAAYKLTHGTYHSPIQWAKDFLAQRTSSGKPPSSYRRGVESVNLWEFLPAEVARQIQQGLPVFDRRWHGLFLKDATLVGPEARGSCPVRLPRDGVTRESIGFHGLYPVGEGAGYAGGIVSAAVDGLRTAKAIIAKYAPLKKM
ncbi:MAG: NAD(P)-binding protein [Planctomycetota bacterium]